MFLSQVWFAAILACSASPEGEIDCREHLVGAFVNNAACVEAMDEVGGLIGRFADPALPASVSAVCFAVTLSEA